LNVNVSPRGAIRLLRESKSIHPCHNIILSRETENDAGEADIPELQYSGGLG